MTHTIRVNQHDLWIMVLSYVRYAMGRMSTAPSTAADFVRSYWSAFGPAERAQIRDEIRYELARVARTGGLLGMDCDHRIWVNLLAWCDVNLDGRPAPGWKPKPKE